MKKLLLLIPVFLLSMSFTSFEEEPQFGGQNCVQVALLYYADLTNGEVGHEAALDASFELLIFCEENQ